MSLETWADNVRRGEYRQAPEHQGAIDVIKTLLEGTIDSDRAATVIASMYNPLLERGFKLSPVPTLWAIICDIIRALGGNTDIAKRLIYLLNSISKLPDVMNDHDNATTPVRGRYWRDLPDLAIMFRENAIGKFRTSAAAVYAKEQKGGLLVQVIADKHDCMEQMPNR